MGSWLSVLVNFWVSYIRVLGDRGIGEECVKIMQIVSCLELMTYLFIFIHNGGILKLLYSPHLKMVLIFFVTKVFQKGTMF